MACDTCASAVCGERHSECGANSIANRKSMKRTEREGAAAARTYWQLRTRARGTDPRSSSLPLGSNPAFIA
eukprot:CAMPEP_0185168722 /NCGR_PEP_ID=MMETSP1139-20130426/16265_1 /TAXON_ID=298111 /ORGANISM="Pavlova sp., Strain CCMP459" /LENGTH=70 /DNA_ID=CAMNT_0027734241 /DNA_START=74 /DNA_END=283 /DNA_ORIENTATION=-